MNSAILELAMEARAEERLRLISARSLLHATLFLWALLAVFRAPAYPFWMAAIFATEAGVAVAVVCCALLVRAPSSLFLWAALLLFLSPLVRALPVAQRLPVDLVSAFGVAIPRSTAQAPSFRAPFRFSTLFFGIRSPQVEEKTVYFATTAGQRLAMDVYQNAGGALQPAILMVHGGSWAGGDRRELPDLDRYLAARGYLVLSMDYRLAPEAHFPAPVDDVTAAIQFMKANAKTLRFNGQLVIFGRSAGGQIALYSAYTLHDPAVRGVISFYGPADMVFAYSRPSNPWIMDSRKVLRTYLGSDQQDAFVNSSPLVQADAASPPTLLVHGLRDELVWPTHAEHLSAKLQTLHRPVYFLRLPWATHGADYVFRGPSGQLTTFAVERFLAAVLPESDAARTGGPQS